MLKTSPFLMFEGCAEAAMNLYISLFPGSSILSISRYGENEEGAVGTVRHAVFTLSGQQLMCIDSPIKHGFTFTPAMSLYVECDGEKEVDRLYAALSEGGVVLMPLEAYPFSSRYAWINDRFGVSWQLTVGSSE